MPVAVAPINRQLRAVFAQMLFDVSPELPGLGINRADTAEMVVMLRDFQHPLPGDIPAAQHILQERENLIRAFGPAEGDNQNSIVGMGHKLRQ